MGKKHEVIIDTEKCIGCGLCAKDCVSSIITIENGIAKPGETGCIACGHCEAICPQNAVTLTGFKEECIAFEEQTRLDSDELLMAIKSRRTVRVFSDKKITADVLGKIIEAGRFAPTGGNAQNTGYIILGSKQVELEKLAVNMFQKLVGPAKKIVPLLKKIKLDDNFFFKKAPLVIVITGNAVNASLAAENMAFMAEACGLGVLFSGFYTMCANHNKKIRKIMKMQKKKKLLRHLL